MEITPLPYIDIQHDTLAVFDDVEQGIVLREDIWISGYKAGGSSVHGKVRVSLAEGGGVEYTARDGVQVDKRSKTNFMLTIPGLGILSTPVRFPRQVIHPPYTRSTSRTPPLHINALAHSPRASQLVVAGPDGYCVIVPTSPDPKLEETVHLNGHVGDVLDAKWFPSGEVILTSSSDLSIRIWGAKDGINPRTLKGHARAVTCVQIIGVGKQVLSAGNDGSIRLWDVGTGIEVKKWETTGRKGVQGLVVVEDETGKRALGGENEELVVMAATQEGLDTIHWSAESLTSPTQSLEWRIGSNLVSVDYSPEIQCLATGHANGVVALRRLSDLGNPTLFRRNESSVYSLHWDAHDLVMSTAAGLPCRLGVEMSSCGMRMWVKEEFAGWEAAGIECWAKGTDGIWCAGGEGGIRRY